MPASGAKVRPLRRAFCSSAAMPTVKASTRSDGNDTETWPQFAGSSMMPPTTGWMPLKSAVDSDVRATSS